MTNISRGIFHRAFWHEFGVTTGFEIARHGGQSPCWRARASCKSVAAHACGHAGVIIIKILAVWTAFSVALGLAIAPGLSRRIRDMNFPPDEEGE
jgi:hypothetical protein